MIKVDVINIKGKKVKEIEVAESVFAADYNEPLVHQVIVAQLANKRQGTKSTLTRTEVRGGGIKPWRQKGTGRARQGSIRAPQWIKGGVVFAPKPRDFSKKVNKKMKAAAFRCALSQKLRDGGIVVVDKIEIKEAKTRLVADVLKNLNAQKKTLLVTNCQDSKLNLAARNIDSLKMSDVSLLNIYDLVCAEKCIITEGAITALSEVYANESL